MNNDVERLLIQILQQNSKEIDELKGMIANLSNEISMLRQNIMASNDKDLMATIEKSKQAAMLGPNDGNFFVPEDLPGNVLK